MELEQYDLQNMNAAALNQLTVAVIGAMLDALHSADDAKLKWDQVIFGAAVAIRAIAGIAGDIERLPDEQVKKTTVEAVMAGLTVNMKAMRVATLEEFEEITAALDQAADEPRH